MLPKRSLHGANHFIRVDVTTWRIGAKSAKSMIECRIYDALIFTAEALRRGGKQKSNSKQESAEGAEAAEGYGSRGICYEPQTAFSGRGSETQCANTEPRPKGAGCGTLNWPAISMKAIGLFDPGGPPHLWP